MKQISESLLGGESPTLNIHFSRKVLSFIQNQQRQHYKPATNIVNNKTSIQAILLFQQYP